MHIYAYKTGLEPIAECFLDDMNEHTCRCPGLFCHSSRITAASKDRANEQHMLPLRILIGIYFVYLFSIICQ